MHNWFRGGPVGLYGPQTLRAIDVLGDRIPRAVVSGIWQAALDAPWDGRPVWFHGDIAVGNLLVRGGRLSAVIDFGTCGVGDPACDLVIAWNLLSGRSREAFRERLGVDDGTWARGRGWALWKALILYAGGHDGDDPQRVIGEIVAEYRAQPRCA